MNEWLFLWVSFGSLTLRIDEVSTTCDSGWVCGYEECLLLNLKLGNDNPPANAGGTDCLPSRKKLIELDASSAISSTAIRAWITFRGARKNCNPLFMKVG